jgi:hypothetical protein
MDKVVKIKLIRDNGAEFSIDNTDWMIPSDGLEGFATVETDISTVQSLLGDGSIITAVRLPHKARTVKCEVCDARYNEQLRAKAREFFNAHSRYKMYITYMGVTRWCEGSLNKFALSEGNIYRKVAMSFTILSENPYLKSYDDFGKDIASITPMAAFPYYANPAWGGALTGYFNFGADVQVYNDGDVSTDALIKIKARGIVEKPFVTINDNMIKLNETLEEGDELVIDMAHKPPQVTLNGTNAIGLCDKHSAFTSMGLETGSNIISYGASSGSTLMSVSVYYNKLYASI